MSEGRERYLIESLEKLVLDWMIDNKVTHEEYRAATDLVIASIQQGEFSLLFDILFEAQATDNGNKTKPGSPEAIEGPFYIAGAPMLTEPYVMPQRVDEAGDIAFMIGRVTDSAGNGLAEIEMDLWHADVDGKYSNIYPEVPAFNLRGRFLSGADGRYEVQTILPPPYEIPKDGPTGQMLKLLGRHCFRPAHYHIKLRGNGYKELTSQLYFKGGEYLDDDVANAVRDGLIIPITKEVRNGKECWIAEYDFAMARVDELATAGA